MEPKSSFEQPKAPLEHNEGREQENGLEKVRIIILQSSSPEDIPDNADPKELYFTKTIWGLGLEGTDKQGQIIPIGGSQKIDDDDIFAAATRKMLNETHLRPVKPLKNVGGLSNPVTTKDGVAATETTTFCVAEISPSDIAYPIDPEIDQIKPINLDHNQTLTLLNEGKLICAGKEYKLAGRLEQGSDDIKILIEYQLSTREVYKKIKLIRNLYKNFLSSEQRQAENNTMKKLRNIKKENLDEVNQFYQEFIKRNQISTPDIKKALKYSNLEEDVESIGSNYPEAWLRVAAIESADLRKISKSSLKELLRNPFLKNLIRTMYNFAGGIDPDEPNLMKAVLYGESSGASYKCTLKQVEKHLGIRDFNKMNNEVNQFLKAIEKEALAAGMGVAEEISKLDQLNKIKRPKNLLELFQYAVGTHPLLADKKPGLRKQYTFEARRKIIMMMLAQKAFDYYEKIVSPQTTSEEQPIEELFEHIVSDEIEIEEAADNGSMANIQMKIGEQKIPGFMTVDTKKPEEVFRKMIVRNCDPTDIKDIQRRAVCLEASMEQIGERVEIQTDDGKTTEDHQIIADFIQSLKNEARQNGTEIKIIKFTRTPLPGEKIESKGGGGGGKVNYAKFYIKNIENPLQGGKPIERYEEVMIFLPSPKKDQTAYQKMQEKKADDVRYAIARLFETKSLRSFMELVFPANIYPTARRLRRQYRKQQRDAT
ncbi:MAG: hypothetical protein ABID45_03800 [Patescibacteria group bacterium]